MRITVHGLWHLGCVTAACLAAAGHDVAGLDPDARVVDGLNRAHPPVQEPGLAERIRQGLDAGRLRFTTDARAALDGTELVWVTFDTPVDERDEADVGYVRRQIDAIADAVPHGAIVLVSSQVPVGFGRALERDWRGRRVRLACAPENLRLGRALEMFERQDRMVVGTRDAATRAVLDPLLAPFAAEIEWMSIESAEMTKHALNAFLATSVAFINEVARLAEAVGADAKEVERGLKSEHRIGRRAYLAPGAPFAGGTLARDVRFLIALGHQAALGTPLFAGVMASNEQHQRWIHEKVRTLLADVRAPVAAVLGLTYTPGTDTLRRSAAVELCRWLREEGVDVRAHDPAILDLPAELRPIIQLCETPTDALAGADVAILATTWADYRALDAGQLAGAMRRAQVVDQHWFLSGTLRADPRITYVAPGNPIERREEDGWSSADDRP